MTFLLTNDDGIDAPGLRSLQRAIDTPAIIVAPLYPLSGCSHQVTTHRPIQIEQRSETAYAVDGTPADCVRIAIGYLGFKPTLVLSGINAGGNLGADAYISGTVAAVREAALHRVPGIAVSHYIHQRRPIDWDRATALTAQVIDQLLAQPLAPGTLWNVNLPHLELDAPDPAIRFCSPCTQPLPAIYQLLTQGQPLAPKTVQYAADYSKRVRDPNSDVEVCFAGSIAVTQLQIWGHTGEEAN